VQRHLQRYHGLVLALRGSSRRWRAVDGRPRWLDLQGQLNDGLARALATESVDVLDVMDDMLKVVTAQVTLRPSGHQFSVEGHENLLQSGMRAGLQAQLRLRQRQLRHVQGAGHGRAGQTHHAHRLPAVRKQEKAQGYVLACAHTAASSELTLETLEAVRPGRHSRAGDRDHRARAAPAGP
jgi:CDP-4-dehydro-6-deoxyglucose reductase